VEPEFVWQLPNMRQLNASRRTFQVRNASVPQNAPHYQLQLPKNISKLPRPRNIVSVGHVSQLAHEVSDWGSGAAAHFGWMREAKRKNTRFPKLARMGSYAPDPPKAGSVSLLE
jgi:hypothetical protein